MAEMKIVRRRRAWKFAHKLVTLGKAVTEREGKDLLYVSTEEICKAMGQPNGANLEAVQKFVHDVVEFMQGYEMYIVCGCGYLSLMISKAALVESAFENDREPTQFAPKSIDRYLDDYILNTQSSGDNLSKQVCEFQRDTNEK